MMIHRTICLPRVDAARESADSTSLGFHESSLVGVLDALSSLLQPVTPQIIAIAYRIRWRQVCLRVFPVGGLEPLYLPIA